jgi:CBS domain-containing protein
MRVQDVMTEGVKTVDPTTTAEDAWNVMRLNRIHHLVVTRANHVVGILSDRDVGGRRGGAVRKNGTVADLMAAPP